MADRDMVSWDSIVGVYMLNRDATGAMDLFEAMLERNVVSWNIIVVTPFTGVGDMVPSTYVLFLIGW
jgi:pentatricopeptide repeat protein